METRDLSPIKPTETELQMRLVVKFKGETLLDVRRFPRNRSAITIADLKTAVEAEAILEELVGVRVHILQEIG